MIGRAAATWREAIVWSGLALSTWLGALIAGAASSVGVAHSTGAFLLLATIAFRMRG
jgi:hypothetical protein